MNHLEKARDEYSRPVHWLIWSEITQTALICSDYEADAVLPLLRHHRKACTNLIAYAAPVTSNMVVFDTLRFYAIPTLPDSWRAPAWLVCDLGIFAGRLYFDFGEQGQPLYQALGLPPPSLPPKERSTAVTDVDLWHELPYEETPEYERSEPFSGNALIFVQNWLAVRRKGQDFSQTMMGELCRGRRLEPEQAGRLEEIEEQEQ